MEGACKEGATYTAEHGGDKKINQQNLFGPDGLPSCSNSRERPSCEKVATELSVQFKKDPPANAEKAVEAAVAETEDGMSEGQINEFLCDVDMDDPQRRIVATKGLSSTEAVLLSTEPGSGPGSHDKPLRLRQVENFDYFSYGGQNEELKHCQVGTRVVNNEDSCHSMKDYIVALYTNVFSALDKVCPTPTGSGFASCKTDTVSIGKIPCVSMDFLSRYGELQASVESSKYNVTSIRNALIKSATAGKDCSEQKYKVSQLSGWSWDLWLPGFMRGGDIMPPQQGKATCCNTVGFSAPHFYNPPTGSSRPLKGAAGALAFLGPEFAIGDIGLAEAVRIVCEDTTQDRRDFNSTLLDAPL
ncbi:hypothetical protein GGR53DRAFT_532008 [Hypoxylon sp. FL1150]|nr:hypothetical protein GGR53DRAFT_532008 [Hypoxylon sp. FL1150]